MSDGRYLAYLASPHWRSVRARALSTKRKRRCVSCGSTERLDVHHLTYERRGRELDADLAVLCRDCHDIVHWIAKRKGMTLEVATNHVMKAMRPLRRELSKQPIDPEQYEISRAHLAKRWQHPGAQRPNRV